MRKEKLEELKEYIEELKVIKVRELFMPSKFLSTKRYECILNNGNVISREKILKNGSDGSASVILPLTKEGNTLLVVQSRPFTNLSVGIELPAGYIEDGEDPMVAAQRELEEETGYVPDRLEFLTNYYQDQGCMGALNHSYIAYNCTHKLEQRLDKDEFIRYFECHYDEALELLDLGYIKDAGSQITLEKSYRKLKQRKYI